MAAQKLPKSILKTPTTSPAGSSLSPSAQHDRNLETALHHANLIQTRKDLELQIVLNIESLLELPTSSSNSNYTSSNPAPEDVTLFKSLMRPFQTSDYDDLITERNIYELCGYALCGKPRVTGRHRVLGTGRGNDFRVAKMGERDKWCVDDEACARKAMFVRVQLSERPAWERGAGEGKDVELLGEAEMKREQDKRESKVVEGLENLKLGEREDRESGLAELALERGENGVGSGAGKNIEDLVVREKETTRMAEAPSLDGENLEGRLGGTHLRMEGYTPHFDSHRHPWRRHASLGNSDDDDMDRETEMDWQ